MPPKLNPEITPELHAQIRDRFAQIDSCPEQGNRIFFENAGGALTLKTVVETSARYAAVPDNQGRANDGSEALVRKIAGAKAALAEMMKAPGGQFFVGESGTELLFRLIMNACLNVRGSGQVLGSTLEHPATRSACRRWADIADLNYHLIPHNNQTGNITAEDYASAVQSDTKVATVIHTSPVTGMGVDVPAVVAAIRKVAPGCLVIIDGIQHAAHGEIDLSACDADGYVLSPYKMFSRHGYGLAWISDRLSAVEHDELENGPAGNWELGTRDTGAYATMLEVVRYLNWLGGEVSGEQDAAKRFEAAGAAIHAHETKLTDAMINGQGNLPGLREYDQVHILGGADNAAREGLVSFWADGHECPDIVAALNSRGIRTHVRRNDHYSGTVLAPLGRETCVRVSLCHYNSLQEVAEFLAAIKEILNPKV